MDGIHDLGGTAACAELGFEGIQGEYIVALECLAKTHPTVVCTQCSCTAWPVLGLPPNWYKSPEYRARVVRNSRQVLHEPGLDLPTDVNIQVWDTTAETRYIVLPLQSHPVIRHRRPGDARPCSGRPRQCTATATLAR